MFCYLTVAGRQPYIYLCSSEHSLVSYKIDIQSHCWDCLFHLSHCLLLITYICLCLNFPVSHVKLITIFIINVIVKVSRIEHVCLFHQLECLKSTIRKRILSSYEEIESHRV
jgi:hypothetical protein